MLFPLTLTAFENYMLADDRADQPMCFFLQLSFWGSLEQAAFRAAVSKTVSRHPLFHALVQDVNGQPSWVGAKNTLPQITWDDEPTLTSGHSRIGGEATSTGVAVHGPREGDRHIFPGTTLGNHPTTRDTFLEFAGKMSQSPARERLPAGYLDLSREVGIRLFVTHTDGQARVLFQFHHACTDGIGAVRFIEDLLAIYTSEQSDDAGPPRLAPVNSATLRDRGRHGLGLLGRLLRLPIDSLAALGIAQFFFNRPRAIETPNAPRSFNALRAQPTFVSRRVSQEQLRGLRSTAKEEGVTVNDLLVRDLMLSIDAWNARHNPTARGGCTRITVPVNLRQPVDATLPSTNAVSMVFVDRRVKDGTNPRRLLKSIRRDTFFVKTFRLALVFTWIIELLQAIRGGFAWMLGGEGCLATAVLSNLGVQFDDLPLGYLGDRVIVGDALLDKVDFLPPIRRGTNASLGVVTYAGELMISLQYEPCVLSTLVADDLLRLFDDQLAITAGRTPPTPESFHTSKPATVRVM